MSNMRSNGKFAKQDDAERPSISSVPGLIEAIKTHGKASEKTVMSEIVAMLEARGFRKPLKANRGSTKYFLLAGQRKTKHSGSDSGVPDLLIFGKGWCLPVEAKAREAVATIKPSQFTLWLAGCLHIVNTAEQVENLLDASKASV
jgi:hypothetical protein